ncbi:MAG: hypothetical protein CL677_03440 [Bdellovibrionaceae bacterium]|nr:hypothetical protein [Pseudobdellovibrionaceae bacterium]|tara:strand:- start:109389 stop:110003 length:615 start_codon:yes stop_codon:yes gene_type:complete
MSRSLIVLALIALSLTAHGSVVSQTVGEVRDHVLTSREVLINLYIESALFGAKVPPPFDASKYHSRVSGVLLEWVVYKEALSFNTDKIKPGVIQSSLNKVKFKWGRNSQWQKLQAEQDELTEIIERKLRAKEFIKFKANSSVVPVSDEEAKEYYDNNQRRFGDVPFQELSENIKAFLKKQQLDSRLKSWFEVLQSKYQVRNHLI